MSLAPPPIYVDRSGQPLAPHIQAVLRAVRPRLRRDFPTLQDDTDITEVLEVAGRRVADAERRHPVRELHRYAWAVVRTVAISRTRLRRISQSTLELADSTDILAAAPAVNGTLEEIERRILVREIMEMLDSDEQQLMILKTAGFTSPEIGVEWAVSSNTVDAQFSRLRMKIRSEMAKREAASAGVAPEVEETGGRGRK